MITCAEEWRLGSFSCPLWLSSACLLLLLRLAGQPLARLQVQHSWLGKLQNVRLRSRETWIVHQPAKDKRATMKILVNISKHLTKGGWWSLEQRRPHSHSCFDGRGAGRSDTPWKWTELESEFELLTLSPGWTLGWDNIRDIIEPGRVERSRLGQKMVWVNS